MIFFGRVQNGIIKYVNEHKVNEFLDTIDNKEIKVDIKVKRNKRSKNQNALYWMWLDVISEYTGYDSDELHNSFRAMFLTNNRVKPPLVRSTSLLDTGEFTKYLDKIKLYALENISPDLKFPNPEDLYLSEN
jgi:hypothetical protein